MIKYLTLRVNSLSSKKTNIEMYTIKIVNSIDRNKTNNLMEIHKSKKKTD